MTLDEQNARDIARHLGDVVDLLKELRDTTADLAASVEQAGTDITKAVREFVTMAGTVAMAGELPTPPKRGGKS